MKNGHCVLDHTYLACTYLTCQGYRWSDLKVKRSDHAESVVSFQRYLWRTTSVILRLFIKKFECLF